MTTIHLVVLPYDGDDENDSGHVIDQMPRDHPAVLSPRPEISLGPEAEVVTLTAQTVALELRILAHSRHRLDAKGRQRACQAAAQWCLDHGLLLSIVP